MSCKYYGCYSLTSIEIPSGVTTIGDSFNDCENLVTINIPNTVVSIDTSSFCGCSSVDEPSRNAILAINPDAFEC